MNNLNIRVFKFGGASVKNADAVRNAVSILKHHGKGNILLVISAMGKTTNALEKIQKSLFDGDKVNADKELSLTKEYHFGIARDLFSDPKHEAFSILESRFSGLISDMNKVKGMSFDESYDLIVHYGELLSTELISSYILSVGLNCKWLDARQVVMADERFCNTSLLWKETEEKIQMEVLPSFGNGDNIILTQGFIGSSISGKPVTLGREGSDYSASIFAYCLDARDMTIWKDVPGLMNADPKVMESTERIEHISYREAVELAYYGATIMHPKTIKPLENKFIPLYIRSFVEPDSKGSVIDQNREYDGNIPSYIFKFNQILLSISPRDFSFVDEHNLHEIFGLFAKHNIPVFLMQNSAISFSVCTDNDPYRVNPLVEDLKKNYKVLFNENVELITIRHYLPEIIARYRTERSVLLEQKSRHTFQLVVRSPKRA